MRFRRSSVFEGQCYMKSTVSKVMLSTKSGSLDMRLTMQMRGYIAPLVVASMEKVVIE